MLPVISTRPLMNFELTLSPDGTRVGNHRCSNLLDYKEVTTGHSFITASTRNPDSMGDTAPYQFSGSLRGNSTLRFYRNLNLEACLWEFSSYYHMSELLTDCGGTIGTDGQVGLCLRSSGIPVSALCAHLSCACVCVCVPSVCTDRTAPYLFDQ